MGFWSILNSGNIRGKCETNFFHIYIYDDLPDTENIDIFGYDDSLKGTFMHEYLHYIQFINTTFGISYSTIYNNYFSYCVDYFSKNDNINIPLNILSNYQVLSDLIKKYKNLKGSKNSSIEIDKIEIDENEVNLGKEENRAIKLKGINSKTGETEFFEFGYLCIIENMATIFQSFFDEKEQEHSIIPYKAVEIICKNKQITDKKMIFSICLCSLMYNNPAFGFFDVLKILQANQNYNGIKLYKHLLYSNVEHKQCNSIQELFLHLIDNYEYNIKSAICSELVYFSKVFENCKLEVQNGKSILLRLIYETNINSKESIECLTNYYGIPYIEANNLILMAKIPQSNSSGYLDIANLRGLEMVVNRLTNTQDARCPMFEKCYKLLYNGEIDNKFEMSCECKNEQWKKQEKCLMSVSMKKYKLDSKTIIQK
jgi:hypothetical protein